MILETLKEIPWETLKFGISHVLLKSNCMNLIHV